MKRPAFLDQHSWWTKAPRTMQSRADYASPLEHHPSPRSWLLSDMVIAALLVGVMVALFMGVL